MSVTIPAGVGDGTTLHLEGQGLPYYAGGPAGPLVLTISIPAQASSLLSPQDSTDSTVAVSQPNAELPSVEKPSVPPARTKEVSHTSAPNIAPGGIGPFIDPTCIAT